MFSRLPLVVAMLLVAGSACAHRTGAGSAAATPQPADSVIVNITNTYLQTAVIFVRAGTHSYRMGTVDPGSTGRFVLRFPWIFGRGAEFVAEGLTVTIQSGYLSLNPGDVVDWAIAGNLLHTRPELQP